MDEQSMSDQSHPSLVVTKLPPVKQLIVESWELLTKKALKLMFLGLLSITIYVGMLIFALLVVFGAGVMSFSSFSDPDVMLKTLSNPGFIGTVISAGILFMVAMIALGTALQAAMLILLKDPNEDTSVITYLKQGFSYIIPLLAVSAITFVIIFGSFFVLIIPAMIIGLFFMFTIYAVVVDNKKGMDAIKMSVGIVSQNFGAIIWRVILLWLLSFAIQMLIGALPTDGPSATMFHVLISFVASIAVGWFGLTYSYRLYVHAKVAYDAQKPASMTWMWIISVLGWIIVSLIIAGIISAVGNANIQKTIEDAIQKEMKSKMEKDFDIESDFNYDEGVPVDQLL